MEVKVKGKVQTIENKVNVLVETATSNERHISHLDVPVVVTHMPTNDEIINEYSKCADYNQRLADAKIWLKKQPGYAVSAVFDTVNNIRYGDIVRYQD